MQSKAPIRSHAMSPTVLGERPTRSTGQREGSKASRSSGQTRSAFRAEFELSVVAVASAAYGGLDASLRQPLAIANRHVLRTAVAVMHQGTFTLVPARVQGLLQGVEHEVGCIELLTRQPTMYRAKISMTKAT